MAAAEIVIPLGKDAALFYAECVVSGPPTFVAANVIDAARDVTVTLDKDEADASRRSFPGWHDTREGMKSLRISFEIVGVMLDGVGTEPAAITAIRTAFLTGVHGTSAGIALYARADKDHATESDPVGGMWGDFYITKFDRAEPLGDVQTYSVEATATLVHGNVPAMLNTLPA